VNHERRPRIPTVPNLRDVGGLRTGDGRRVGRGAVYRSGRLSGLRGAEVTAFRELGIGTVFDLRTAQESAEHPDVLPAGTRLVHLDVLADARHAAPAELQQIFEDPSRAGELLREGQAERYFETAYRGFVTLPSARSAYRELFESVAAAETPVLFHCSTGKDRTGWATAALLLLLGVPEETVREDYLLTNTELRPHVQPWLDQFAASGGDPRLMLPIVGVLESYLEAALQQVRESFGSIEDYATTGLGLSPATVLALRHRLVPDQARADST